VRAAAQDVVAAAVTALSRLGRSRPGRADPVPIDDLAW
jgi:hypothetical protein